MSPPVVAVVGRPNVGKSTFVNRAVGKRVAIVEDHPGVTRDRKVLEAEWLGIPFLLVDTGGWLPSGSDLDHKVSRQVEEAVRGADLIVFLVDASVGITEEDDAVASWLRRAGKPVLLGVNKADNNQREDERWQFLSLGLGEPLPISALHGRRTGDFLDEVIARLPASNGGADGSLVARRNWRRSTRWRTGRYRLWPSWAARTSARAPCSTGSSATTARWSTTMPGTTRDAIDTVVDTVEGPIRFVDTAGMRRKSRVDDPTEYYSLVRALRAVDESDIALLVIDATEGVTAQDQRLAERIDAAGCPVIVLLNKWELLDDPDDRADVLGQMARKLHFIGDAPVLQVSALTGKGVHKLLPVLADAIERYHRRVPTRAVNAVISAAQQAQPAPGGARVLYALQGAADPPTFTLFVNRELPPTYLRYLERKLREHFDLGAVPIKLRVRKRSS